MTTIELIQSRIAMLQQNINGLEQSARAIHGEITTARNEIDEHINSLTLLNKYK